MRYASTPRHFRSSLHTHRGSMAPWLGGRWGHGVVGFRRERGREGTNVGAWMFQPLSGEAEGDEIEKTRLSSAGVAEQDKVLVLIERLDGGSTPVRSLHGDRGD